MCCFLSGYMRHTWFVAPTLLVLITACRSSGSITTGTPTPTPATTEPSPRSSISSVNSWHISPVTALRRYRVSTATTLETNGVHDSISSVIVLSIGQEKQQLTEIFSGTVDSFTLQSGSHIGNPAFTPKLPIAFSGHLRQSEIELEQKIECSTQLPVAAIIQKIIWNLPVELRSEQTWTDSSSVTSCNGSLPASVKTVRTYRVTGEDRIAGIPYLLITRTDRTSSISEGSQEQHQVRTSSSTSGTVNLWIDSQNGALIRSAADYFGTVTVTASGRSQVFTHRIKEIIEEIR